MRIWGWGGQLWKEMTHLLTLWRAAAKISHHLSCTFNHTETVERNRKLSSGGTTDDVETMSCLSSCPGGVYKLLSRVKKNTSLIQLFSVCSYLLNLWPVFPLRVLQVPSVRSCLPLKINGSYWSTNMSGDSQSVCNRVSRIEPSSPHTSQRFYVSCNLLAAIFNIAYSRSLPWYSCME